MVRYGWLFALVSWGLFACSSEGPVAGGETNFLGTCESDDQCAEGFACACGACTLRCVSDVACALIEDPSVCVFADVPAFYHECGGDPSGVTPPGICLPACEVDADCAVWNLPWCNAGACSENAPVRDPNLVPSGAWGQTKGPVGTGRAPIFASAKGQLFLAGAEHLLRSTDGGSTWAEVAGRHAEEVVEVGDTLVARFGSSVFASTDGGASWTSKAGAGLEGEIFALRAGGGRLWAVTGAAEKQLQARAAIRVSDDAGATWTAVAPLPDEDVVGEVFAAEDVVLATGLYSGRLHRSVDGGATWTTVAEGGAGWAARFAAHGRDLFALGHGARGVFRSGDRGLTWTETMLSFGEAVRVAGEPRLVSNGTELFAAPGDGRIYRWEMALDGWTEVTGGLRGAISALAASADGVWLGVDELLYRWSRTKRAWEEVDFHLVETGVVALAEGEGMLLASTGGAVVHRSVDEGLRWTRSGEGLPADAEVTGLAILAGRAWAATAAHGVFRSVDGIAWTDARVPVVGDGTPTVVRAFAGAGDVVLAASGDPEGVAGQGVLRTVDGGQTWEVFDEGLPRAAPGAKAPMAVVALVAAGDLETFYAAIADGGVYRTRSAGAVWERFSAGIEGRVVALAAGGDRLVAAAARADGSVLYELRDGAWVALGGAPFGGRVRGLAVRYGMLVVSIEGEGVRVSLDGEAWMAPQGADESGALEAGPLAVAGDAVFAGTPSAGVWRLELAAGKLAR